MLRTYTELCSFKTFEERFEYLRLDGEVGKDTFGFDRVFNQQFYSSLEWKQIRNYVIVRDNGCDLGIESHEIPKGLSIFIHHLNPITVRDIDRRTLILLDPEYLITTIFRTHNAIHYGDAKQLAQPLVERIPNDTCPWRH